VPGTQQRLSVRLASLAAEGRVRNPWKMDEPNFDPDLVEKAKEITAGPLGREMTKFPLRFAKMAFFGERPSQNKTSKINHGTVTLLELKGKQIALTCSHVLDEYRKIYTDPKVVFQLGDVDFNPFERIIAESSQLDFVSIDINDLVYLPAL
jgi:hypothetical protein